jgi:polar amino acid transport system substrate-binding protein
MADAQDNTQKVTDAVRSELAPTGCVRVGINFGNALLARRDESGAPRGIAVTLAQELSGQLRLPMEIVSYNSAGRMADGAVAGTWDVAFLAADPDRAGDIDFSAPYLEIDTTYLVWAQSPIRTLADVDAAGVRISVTKRSAYDLFLTRSLKHAELLRAPVPEASVDLFFAAKLDALAGLKPLLMEVAEKHPGTRVLDGSFATVYQAVGVPKGRTEAARWIRGFVERIKESGFVARTIQQNRVRGISVAAP